MITRLGPAVPVAFAIALALFGCGNSARPTVDAPVSSAAPAASAPAAPPLPSVDIADDALIGTMATVVISPEGAVRVELSGAGLFSSERAFFDAVGARQSQIMQAIVGARASAK